MYNYNKTINRFDNLNDFDTSKKNFVAPHHIYKLLNKLKNFEAKATVNHILKISACNVKQDADLKNIFDFFKWNEEKRMFETEVKQEDLIKKIGLVYDLKTEEIKKQVPIVVEEDTRQINRKGSGNNSNLSFHKYTTNNPHGVFETLNGDLSFSQSRNDGVESIFQVQKPIAITNSQGFDRNLTNYEFNDVFLTNSGKVGWNQHSLHLGDDESSLLSNWRRNNKISRNTKTPSFHNTDDEMKLNQTDELNSNNCSNNFNNTILKNNLAFSKKGHINTNYSEYLKSLKINEGTQKFSINNPNFSNFNKHNLISFNEPQPDPTFITTNQSLIPQVVPDDQISRNFRVSTFKVENKRRKKKELKKKNSKKLSSQFRIKSPKNIKKLGEKPASKRLDNSSRSSHFGLKEISKKVKEIVKKLRKTTYKEISDLIINQMNEKDTKDEKNIRRRIYDSLNVMKAMNLFEKDPSNKFILWKGEKLNNFSNDDLTLSNFSFKKRKRSMLEEEELASEKLGVEDLRYLIKYKKEELDRKLKISHQLWEQDKIFKDLLKRNEEQKNKISEEEKIRFPFIIIEFPEQKNPNNINIISNDNKSLIHFSLDTPVCVYGDLDALKKINNKLSQHAVPKNTTR